jgi:RHS repeat-associated protein
MPFGEEVYESRQGHGGDSVRRKFTGYERDGETDLDYAHARYYASIQGRFSSPDPLLASRRYPAADVEALLLLP